MEALNIDWMYLTGIAASIISISGITQQLIRVIRIRDAKAHSYSGLGLISVSLFLYITFGIRLHDPVVFWVNVIGFSEFVTKIGLKYYFERK